jgi:hypothetical protein
VGGIRLTLFSNVVIPSKIPTKEGVKLQPIRKTNRGATFSTIEGQKYGNKIPARLKHRRSNSLDDLKLADWFLFLSG